MVRLGLCVLHPEVLILPTTPEALYLVVVVRVCVRLKSEKEQVKVKLYHLGTLMQIYYIKYLPRFRHHIKKKMRLQG